MAAIRVPKGVCPLTGKPVPKLDLEGRYDLILLGVVDRKLHEHFVYSQTSHDMLLRAGDILVVKGPADAIDVLKKIWRKPLLSKKVYRWPM